MASSSRTGGDGQANPAPSRRRGCMLCRMEVTVDDFFQLQAGDQISMPGRAPLVGRLYDHHAVVANIENISDDGQTAKLTVFDVDEKGKTGTVCPCNRKPYPIKQHGLYNKEDHRLSTQCMRLSGRNAVVLRKVVYRKRKFDQATTVQRAHLCQMSEQNDDIKYCFCFQNCEHFASACVNGPDDVVQQSLTESLSVQSLDCAWIFFSAFFWALQALFYGFNFWMYAVFVRKDPDFEFLSDSDHFRDFLNRACYQGESGRRFFQTTCDWMMAGIFGGVFCLLFLGIILCYYVPLYRKKYICTQCFVTVWINLYFSRLVSFFLVEIVNIMAERPLYGLVTGWKMSRFTTILMLMLVSAGGAILVYTLASIMTKTIVMCCSLCSDSMKGYHRFVPYKGFMWCLCKLRCCCRNAKSKYVAEEIEMTEMA